MNTEGATREISKPFDCPIEEGRVRDQSCRSQKVPRGKIENLRVNSFAVSEIVGVDDEAHVLSRQNQAIDGLSLKRRAPDPKLAQSLRRTTAAHVVSSPSRALEFRSEKTCKSWVDAHRFLSHEIQICERWPDSGGFLPVEHQRCAFAAKRQQFSETFEIE